MRDEKSRPPVVETGERRTGRSTDEHTIPLRYYTTDGRRVQGFFERVLPKGAENAVKTAELLRRTGLDDARFIQRLISDERAAGAVILSNSDGYFLPDDGEKGRREAEAFIATVTARGVNTLRAADSARAFLGVLPGQMEIGGAGGKTESGGKL